ncbi:MAG: hypothetical protein ACRCS9_13850 [Hyphomicrobium sp.]
MSNTKDDRAVKVWLEAAIKYSGLRPTPFAKKVGLSASTVVRALDPENPTELDSRSITKIVENLGIPGPYTDRSGTPSRGPGFAEDELGVPDSQPPTFAGEPLTPNQYVREIRTRALELEGYPPGALALFDMSMGPRAGDAVAANIYNLQRGSAETVFRLYDPPYLISRSTDRSVQAKPQLVDNERVKIMAVVTKTLLIRGAA